MKHAIGTFTVRDNSGIMRPVIISQELLENTNGVIESASKQYTIDKQDGKRVLGTKDPEKFVLEDGTQLKKVGSVVTYSLF